MKKENISEVINNIDDKYIEEATMFASEGNQDSTNQHSSSDKKPSTCTRKVRWGFLAACLALFIIIGSTITAFAVEAREYNTALSFFNENGLSTEGLSRSDIKAVYRDITTYSFTFEKTAQVLKRAVPGWEIEHDEPTPEELSAIWNNNVWVKPISKNGIDYRIEGHYSDDTELGFRVLDKCILECYLDGTMLWRTEFSDFYVHGYSFIKNLTIVWGYNIRYSTYERQQGYIALVDNSGNTLWQQCLNHDFKDEYITSVLRNTDGTWAVISRGDYKYLCLSCYDYNGKELSFHKTEIGNYGIWNAALLENGYIVQLGNPSSKETALLFKMDKEGNLTEMISYKADDCDYYITDMVEFEGHIYLSAYAVPTLKDESGRREIANILDYTFDKLNEGIMDIPSEELTPIVRNNYTAIILKCDTESGAPKTFYSVKGSLGGKLVVNKQGELEWNVERIVSTYFSPYTSSFTIGGTSSVVKYTFNKSGEFIGQTDTGDTVPFRR